MTNLRETETPLSLPELLLYKRKGLFILFLLYESETDNFLLTAFAN